MLPDTIDPLIVGQNLTPDYFQKVCRAIRRNTPIAGKGIRIHNTLGGTIIEVIPQTTAVSSGSVATETLYPFKCKWSDSVRKTGSGDNAKFLGAYIFYLPKGTITANATGKINATLNFNNKPVNFMSIDDTDVPEDWMRFNDFGFPSNTAGTVKKLILCVIDTSDESNYTSAMRTLDQAYQLGVFNEDSSYFAFPVCDIKEVTTAEQDKNGNTVYNVSRTITQYAAGTMYIASGDSSDVTIFTVSSGTGEGGYYGTPAGGSNSRLFVPEIALGASLPNGSRVLGHAINLTVTGGSET